MRQQPVTRVLRTRLGFLTLVNKGKQANHSASESTFRDLSFAQRNGK
jgi:hypothetical protein